MIRPSPPAPAAESATGVGISRGGGGRDGADALPVELREHHLGGWWFEAEGKGEPWLAHHIFYGTIDRLFHLPFESQDAEKRREEKTHLQCFVAQDN